MNTILKKLPNPIKKKIYNYILSQLRQKWIEVDKTIPKFELEEKHIKNFKVLTNRSELLEHLPNHAIVAEVGVNKGEFSQLILDKCSPRKLHLIDSWETERYHSGLQNVVKNKFNNRIEQGIIKIHKGWSTNIGNDFPDKYFDWIYIDTDHTYQTTKAELEIYSKKVKPNGIIAGHDFIIGNWNGMVRYGVIEAVYEHCVKNNWEMIFLTIENEGHPSFAIRRLK